MTERGDNGGKDRLHEAVRLRQSRREQWLSEGERSLWKNVSMIGTLGWLIVTPLLLCTFLGRWLDRTFETGIFFSGALIFLGVGFGAYLAWQRVRKEEE